MLKTSCVCEINQSITKIETDLGWKAQENFESGIDKTIKYYLEKYQ